MSLKLIWNFANGVDSWWCHGRRSRRCWVLLRSVLDEPPGASRRSRNTARHDGVLPTDMFLCVGRTPTKSTSENPVPLAKNSMPWETNSTTQGKYQYHPGGDASAAPKDAPSAVNVVIVPNVTLPKV